MIAFWIAFDVCILKGVKACLNSLKPNARCVRKWSSTRRALSLTGLLLRTTTRDACSVNTSRANRTGEEYKRTYFLPRFYNLKGASLDSRPQSSQREYRLYGLKETVRGCPFQNAWHFGRWTTRCDAWKDALTHRLNFSFFPDVSSFFFGTYGARVIRRSTLHPLQGARSRPVTCAFLDFGWIRRRRVTDVRATSRRGRRRGIYDGIYLPVPFRVVVVIVVVVTDGRRRRL